MLHVPRLPAGPAALHVHPDFPGLPGRPLRGLLAGRAVEPADRRVIKHGGFHKIRGQILPALAEITQRLMCQQQVTVPAAQRPQRVEHVFRQQVFDLIEHHADVRPLPELIPRNDDLRAAGKQHFLHPNNRLVVHRADDVQAAAAVDNPGHIDAGIRLQDAQVGDILQLGDKPLHVLFQRLRQRIRRRQHLLDVCAVRELIRNQLGRFLLADAVVIRHVAGFAQVKPGNQQVFQRVLVEVAEQVQLGRFPRPQVQQGEVRAVRPEYVWRPCVPLRVEVHHRIPEIAHAANEGVGGHHALAAAGQAEDLHVGFAPRLARHQYRLALFVLAEKDRLLLPGLRRGEVGQCIHRHRLPEMQVANVSHLAGALAAASALLIKPGVDRLVSGRKMLIEEQERQQPRHHHPGDQPGHTPGYPEQVRRLQQVIIRVRIEVRAQDALSPALDIHRNNQHHDQRQPAPFKQQMQPVPQVATGRHRPPWRIERSQHRKRRGPVIIATVAIGILLPLFAAQAHIAHPARPGRKQPGEHANDEKRDQQGDMAPKQPADPRENLLRKRRNVPLPRQRIQVEHVIPLSKRRFTA
ncbi:Uncharacterised protein [Yersinia frederiksenii]|nr:Uncharacterised protein [Yersinia frederiksenii]